MVSLNEYLLSASTQITSKTTQSRHFSPFYRYQLAVANYKFLKNLSKQTTKKKHKNMKVFSDTNQFMATFTIISILLDLKIGHKI